MAKNNKVTEEWLEKHPDVSDLKVGDQIPEQYLTVEVPVADLTKLQEQMAEMERTRENDRLEIEGMKQALENVGKSPDDNKLREKKNFEPKFRTVRIRKYPIAGDVNNMGYVIGWTDRGAYEEVDKTGVAPQIVNYIEIQFLGHERNKDGKLQAEKVRLLDLLNRSSQVHCKILEEKKEPQKTPTGEEIDVTVFDPQHGLVSTGEKIDGFVTSTDIKFKIQVPGVPEPVWIDAEYCN